MSNNDNTTEDAVDDISRLLDSIEDKRVKNITNQLIRMQLSGKDKLERLEQHLNGRQMEWAKKIITVTERNFLDDLSAEDREFVEYFIPKNDFTVIGEIVNKPRYKQTTKMAYKMWKEKREEEIESTASTSAGSSKGHLNEMEERAPKRRQHDPLTILLMGETGVGKSTFINSLVNMIAYSDFETILERGLHVPISASLTMTDAEYVSHKISHESTIGEFDGEVHQDGMSCTQKPKTYVFRCGPLEDRRELRIIDTPGFGDTRGEQQDKENLKNILDAVSKHREIHAIAYVLPSNNSRLSSSFLYCLNEFFVHLHKSAVNNIFFCFTNARSSHYLPGESHKTLESYLRNVGKLDITLTKNNLFAFENDAFRYLCSVRKNNPIPGTRDDYRESWKNAAQEYKRLLSTVAQIPPHNVRDMVSVNRVGKTLEFLRQPLYETTRLHLATIKQLNEKCQELNKLGEQGELIQTKWLYNVVELKTELVDRPIVVCNHPNCVSVINLNDINEKIHKEICYTETNQTRVRATPKEMIECAIFKEGKCRKCGHSWQEHRSKDFKIVSTTKKVMDMDLHEKFKTVNEGKQQVEEFIEQCRERIKECENELSVITKAIALSTVFLTEHSILPYEDKIDEYLGAMVEEEADREWDLLRKFKENYTGLVKEMRESNTLREIENTKEKRGSDTLREIENTVTQLKKLPLSGKFLRDVEMMEESMEMKKQVRDEIVVELGNDYNKHIFHR